MRKVTDTRTELANIRKAMQPHSEAMRDLNAQAEKLGYAFGYCPDEDMAKPGCKHDSHSIYDSKTDRHGGESFQPVCTRCGKIGKFSRVRKDCSFGVRF